MLPSQRNKETITILRKLKQQGAPAPTPMDGLSPFPGDPEADAMRGEGEVVAEENADASPGMQDQQMDAMGQVLRAPAPGLAGRMKKKQRPVV